MTPVPQNTHTSLRDIHGTPAINLFNATQTDIRGVYGAPKITLVGKNMMTSIDGVYGSPEMFITEEPPNASQMFHGSTVEQSWEKVTKEMNRRDEGDIKTRKGEIDMLIVVAAISSIVFALFTLESSRWLSEDPGTTSAALLTRISQQLATINQAVPSSLTPLPPFHPPRSTVAINSLWFLSLILSIASIVGGLLCKQWLDEHFQYTHTRTPSEALGLRRLRQESLGFWGVPTIMAQLPILLEFAFLSFFAGLLVVFWLRSVVLFIIGLVVIGIVFIFYLVTTLLPSVQIVHHSLKPRPSSDNPATIITHLSSLRSVCPYKTPQAKAAFAIVRSILGTSSVKKILYRFSGMPSFGMFQDNLDYHLRTVPDWPSLDLAVMRTFEGIENAPSFYEISGLQWLLKTFRDTSSMVPHLTNILNSLPSPQGSLVTSIALDDLKVSVWKKLERGDIEAAIRDPLGYFAKERSDAGLDTHAMRRQLGQTPHSLAITQLLYYLSAMGNDRINWKSRLEMTEVLYNTTIPLQTRMPFVVPFYELEKLWCIQEDSSGSSSERDYEKGIALGFLHFYRLGWATASKLDSGPHDKLALVKALTNHIIAHEFKHSSSVILTSPEALGFLQYIDGEIREEGLSENGDRRFANVLPDWRRALALVEMIQDQTHNSMRIVPLRSGHTSEVRAPVSGGFQVPAPLTESSHRRPTLPLIQTEFQAPKPLPHPPTLPEYSPVLPLPENDEPIISYPSVAPEPQGERRDTGRAEDKSSPDLQYPIRDSLTHSITRSVRPQTESKSEKSPPPSSVPPVLPSLQFKSDKNSPRDLKMKSPVLSNPVSPKIIPAPFLVPPRMVSGPFPDPRDEKPSVGLNTDSSARGALEKPRGKEIRSRSSSALSSAEDIPLTSPYAESQGLRLSSFS